MIGKAVPNNAYCAGETRRILFAFELPGYAALGAATICELELRWVGLATLTENVATVPVNVNVVPGDGAGGARLMREAAAAVPASASPEMLEEIALLESLADESDVRFGEGPAGGHPSQDAAARRSLLTSCPRAGCWAA